ncbi:MAG TPA: polysaccharide deacetylase family protein [Blastocatellia bacterium]|nr:polysaccharide deacetylase family protein [Blastocatellia bacterium]
MAASTLSTLFLSKHATGARVPVLCYHRVLPELMEGERPLYTMTPEEFATQMAFLADRGFRSLSLDEYARLATGQSLPPARSVLVTFDDGYADNYHLAWAIANHYGIKLNLLVCTGLIEGEIDSTHGPLSPEAEANRAKYPQLWRPLTWSEIGQMAEAGVGIGFHSHTHRNFGRMTATEIAQDVATGMSLLDLRLAMRPRAFAFPGGSSGTYNSTAISTVKRCGLELLFTTHLGRTRLGGKRNLFSRLVIYQDDDPEVFQRKLFGAYDWLGRARSMDQLLRALFHSGKVWKSLEKSRGV